MSNPIKEFFKKKKLELNFKRAGTGHRLADSANKGQSGSVVKTDKPLNKPSVESAASKRAAEAALKRLGGQTQQKKHNTLENILQEERKKIVEKYKTDEQLAESPKQDKLKENEDRYKDFESKQRFSCPDLGLFDSQPLSILTTQIQEHIIANYADDMILMSAVSIKNCNYSASDDYQEKISQCVSILNTIISNLSSSNNENRDKFRKVRKSKIEKKVLDLIGGQEFLLSIGFELDSDEEWFVYNNDDSIIENMNYFKDVLNDAQQFELVLDRQAHTIDQTQKNATEEPLSDDFFKISVSEVTRKQQELTEKKDLEESLRTRAMREQTHKKVNCKYSRLRFKFPTSVLMEATFASNELLSDVKIWLSQHMDSNFAYNLKCGKDVFTEEQNSKTLNELNLVPSASILIVTKDR